MSELARNTDPETSHAAPGDKIVRATIRANIIKILRQLGAMSDERLVDVYTTAYGDTSATPQGIRSRRAELVRDGIVGIDLGKYGETKTGRRCLIWKLEETI